MRNAKVLLIVVLIAMAVLVGILLLRRYIASALVDGPGMVSDWRSRVYGEWVTTERGHEQMRLIIDNSGTLTIYEGEKPVYDGSYTCDAESFRLWPVDYGSAVENGGIPYAVFLYAEGKEDKTAAGDTLTGWFCDPDEYNGKNASALFVRRP